MIRARMRARLRPDERGFTIIETVVAITVIFGSLTALAYTATAGFGYQDAARQRQTANGLASQLMERVRGLTTTQITMGLLSTDLTDPLIVSGAFRPVSGCTAGSPAGCTEPIVSSPAQASFPLNKHLWCSSTSQTTTINNVPYSCGTYVTRDTSVTNAPYRLTIIVTWTGGARGPNKIVRLQSLFTSPPGCTSSTSHPFPGPCQGFFSVQATEPSVDINIATTAGSSAPGGTSFTTGDLLAAGVTASEQTEQSSTISATLRTAGGSMTSAAVPSVGNVTVNAAADDNPDTSISTDSARQRCGTEFTCTITGSPSLSSASGNTISMAVPTTTGESDGSTTSGGTGITSICPISGVDSDNLPCGGATGTGGDLTANLTMNSPTPGWGSFALAKIANPSTATVYVDRQFATGYGCTSPSPTVGCVGGSATRSLGTVTIGDLPAVASWSKRPASWAGFLTLTGYSDSAVASVGSGAAIAVPTIAGTLKCWNGGQAGAYVTYSDLKSATLDTIGPSQCTYTDFIGVGANKATITISLVSVTAGSVSPTAASGPLTLTTALAQAVAPTATVKYQVTFAGVSASNDVNLTITTTLGTAKVQGSYVAAPAGP
ncbi:MAG: hypothetical protein ABI635_02270 [Actinomycetota bacterium]